MLSYFFARLPGWVPYILYAIWTVREKNRRGKNNNK